MSKIRIALAQINPTVGDIEGNFEKIISSIEKAKKVNSDFVIFPELVLVGYPPYDLLLNPDFINTSSQFVKKVVNISENIVVLLGAPFLKNNGLFNACFIIQNRKIKYVYKKMFLSSFSVFDEKRYFSAGKKMPLIFNSQLRFAVTICEDIWEGTSPVFHNFSQKVDIVFNLSASPFFAGKIERRKKMLKNLALKTGAYV
ncbi:MAG: NAD+ synthase, partial [Candidatus Omnitrophota bacterium]